MMTRHPSQGCVALVGAGLTAALATLLVPAGARAQSAPSHDKSFEIQLFQAAISPGSFLTLDTAEVPAHKQFGLALWMGYQRNPFSIYTVVNGQENKLTEVVRNDVTSELTGAIGLFGKLQLGVAVPITMVLDGQRFDDMGRSVDDRSGHGIGDVRLEVKGRLGAVGPDEEIVFALVPGVTLPTGNAGNFMGDKTVTGRLRFLAEMRRGDLRVGGMVGALIREESQIFAAKVGSQLLYGGAASYQIQQTLAAVLELSGRSGLDEFGSRWLDANPVEIDAALRFFPTNMISVTLGGGAGVVKGIGAPVARGFVAVAWTPDFRDSDHDGVYDVNDKCPDQAEDRDGYRDDDGCPDPDNDGDGIPDAQDKCPNDPEDFDQFQDEDGCPDVDNDGDGIPDIKDACPNAPEDGKGKKPADGCPSSAEDSDGDGVPDVRDKCPDDPEDVDGFQDDDGCPDPDNDNDGIPDAFDQCPNEPEDNDGFEDDDGCPDPDNDKDGIPDAQDKCPNKAETLNGHNDEDGCPDPGAPIVRLGANKIEVDERVIFVDKGGKAEVKESSVALVNLVGLVMKGNTDIAKLRIEVHAEGVSKEETQKRADAVKAVLVAKGVASDRVSAVGMGAGPPKVEFIIETMAAPRRKGAPPAAPASAPAETPAP